MPLPKDRPADWIRYKDRVAFAIIDKAGIPRMRTGHICSWPGSHGAGMTVDNVAKTIVMCDQVLNDMADHEDDRHERAFDPKDPALLRLDEIEPLKDPEFAVSWFESKHCADVARQISELLRKSDLGLEDELKARSAELTTIVKRGKVNMSWWRRYGRPAPREELDKVR